MNGTEDGLAVVLPSSAASQAICDTFGFGVVTDALGVEANRVGEVMLRGVHPAATFRRMTRAATTDNWTGSASIAQGVILSMDTVNNCFSTAAANTTIPAFAYLGESLATLASTLSTGSAYGTALIVSAKAFLKYL